MRLGGDGVCSVCRARSKCACLFSEDDVYLHVSLSSVCVGRALRL